MVEKRGTDRMKNMGKKNEGERENQAQYGENRRRA